MIGIVIPSCQRKKHAHHDFFSENCFVELEGWLLPSCKESTPQRYLLSLRGAVIYRKEIESVLMWVRLGCWIAVWMGRRESGGEVCAVSLVLLFVSHFHYFCGASVDAVAAFYAIRMQISLIISSWIIYDSRGNDQGYLHPDCIKCGNCINACPTKVMEMRNK